MGVSSIKSVQQSLKNNKANREPLGKGSPFVYHDESEWIDVIQKFGQAEKEYYTRIYNYLTELQKDVLEQHARDLQKASKKRSDWRYRLAHTQTFQLAASLYELTKRATITWVGAPFAMVVTPVDFIYKTVCFGTIYFFLFIASGVFLTARFLGLSKLFSYLSDQQAGGWSPVNWLDIEIFNNKKRIVDNARIALSSNPDDSLLPRNQVDPAKGLKLSKERPLEFNVDVARALLLLCSVIYERNNTFVKAASEATVCKGQHPNEAELFLLKSEELMMQVAYRWNLRFISMADFGLLNGPFAGAFYDYTNIEKDDHPFIIIVVKGTSPDNFAEWLTDATCKFETCGDYLGAGLAHDGFYRALFPSKAQSTGVLPYMRIINTVKLIAARALEETGKSTNLFVAGHSLGAGIASLLYARLLEKQADLGDNIILRDAYLYGTPRACDFKLATRVEFNLNNPINHGRQIWRIGNRASTWLGDIVTHVPPGYADQREVRAGLNDGAYYAYAAIGTRVDLKPRSLPPFYSITDAPVGFSVSVCKKEDETERAFARAREESQYSFPKDIVQISMWLLGTFVPILHDHFPASYMDSLDKVQCKVVPRSSKKGDDSAEKNSNEPTNTA